MFFVVKKQHYRSAVKSSILYLFGTFAINLFNYEKKKYLRSGGMMIKN